MIAGSSQSVDTVENHKIKLEGIKLFLQGLREAKSEHDWFEDTLEILEREATYGEEVDHGYLSVASISDELKSLSDELNSLLALCRTFESLNNYYLAKEGNMIASSADSSDGEENQRINLDAIKVLVQRLEEAKLDDDLFQDALDRFNSEIINGAADDDHGYEEDVATFDDPSSSGS